MTIAPPLLQNYAADRLRISNAMMPRPGWNERARLQAVVNYVIECENQDGSQFLCTQPDGEVYLVIASLGGEVAALPRMGAADVLHSYLYARYGLSEREKWSQTLYDILRHHGYRHGARATVRRFAVWDLESRTAFLSGHNGKMWKLDGESITVEQNGEHAIFFLDDDGGVTVEPEIGDHGILLDSLLSLNFADTPGGVTHEQQRMAMTVWLFALAFPDMMPTKPFLLIEGAPGSGKSLAVKMMQIALLGDKKPMVMTTKPDEFALMLLRSPLAMFDNLDSYVDWLPDQLCTYATSGVWPRRKLYTDDAEVVIKPQAFVAVASKNPSSFRREDTADRCIVIRLERRADFVPENKLEAQMRALRPKLFGEYLFLLNQIVSVIRADFYESTIESHRMADFAYFSRVVGHVLGWDPADIDAMILALQAERDAFIMEEDSLVELLTAWIKYRPNGISNVGREVGILSLFKDLESISQVQGLPFYKTPRMLVQKLRSPHLERDFVVQGTIVGGQKSFRIWRRTDAQLSVVTDASDTTS